MTQLQPGQIVAEKFRIDRLIGLGGVGVVLAATDLSQNQKVAIKLLHEKVVREDDSAEPRFEREVRAAAQLRGPHVCRVLDAGYVDHDTPFVAMEYLEGRSLAEELDERTWLPTEEACRWIRQACEGVSEAHSLGIVHRSLKPAKLFVAQLADGTRNLKVLDFGLAKPVRTMRPGHVWSTQTSTLVSSPTYMAPEQLQLARKVDTRSDVWALGVSLYELLAGRPPFTGASIVETAQAIEHSEPKRMAELGVEVPPELQRILDTALAKDPEERFQSVLELDDALRALAPDPRVVASGLRPLAASISGSEQVPSAEPALSIRSPRDLPRWTWWTAAAVLLLLTGTALLWSSDDEATQAETAQEKPTTAGVSAAHESPDSRSAVQVPETAPVPKAVQEAEGRAAAPEAEGIKSAAPERHVPRTVRPRRSAKRRRAQAARSAAAEPAAEPAPASARGTEPTERRKPAAAQQDGLPSFGGRR